jgi:phosphotransferase system enzyme I (PtsI)
MAKTVTTWKSKKVYQIVTPENFDFREIGETVASDPERLKGRTVNSSLGELMDDRGKNYMNLVFEIVDVKGIFEDVKEELRRKGEAFDERIPLGVMIEVPAAAALADLMLKEVDFVSIGTNDLIQYYLAVDRANEFVTYLYKPFHPAVIRLIRSVIHAALKAEKDVVVCGEMAADTPSAILLLGFGLRTFSMNPIFIPRVKKALRSIECRTAEKIAEEILKLRSAQEI